MSAQPLRTPVQDVDQTIGLTIEAIRVYQRRSKPDVYRALGMSRTAYYDRLSGTTKWGAAEVKRAADALGVSVATLFDGLSVAGAGFEPATSGQRARRHLALVA